MMKKLMLIGIVLSRVSLAGAQHVSLTDAEIGKLKKLVVTDQSAGKLFNEWQQIAEAALTESPNPIDTIRTEGLLQGNPKKVATQNALLDLRKMYGLALTYRLKGETKYLNKSVAYLLAWCQTTKHRGNPIDDTNLDLAVETYDLLKKAISPDKKQLIMEWLSAAARKEIETYNPKKQTSFNNWNSHRIKEVGEIGVAIDSKEFQDWAITALKEQIARNLMPDGSSIDFKLRDALHYHTYDLEPLIKLSIILKRATGVDYYNYVSPQGSSIKKSTEWFLPYVTGAKTHAEFVNSTVAFDKQRAENGEKGYAAGTLFEGKTGLVVFYYAEYFFPDAANIIQKVTGSTANFIRWQQVLNRVRK